MDNVKKLRNNQQDEAFIMLNNLTQLLNALETELGQEELRAQLQWEMQVRFRPHLPPQPPKFGVK